MKMKNVKGYVMRHGPLDMIGGHFVLMDGLCPAGWNCLVAVIDGGGNAPTQVRVSYVVDDTLVSDFEDHGFKRVPFALWRDLRNMLRDQVGQGPMPWEAFAGSVCSAASSAVH